MTFHVFQNEDAKMILIFCEAREKFKLIRCHRQEDIIFILK